MRKNLISISFIILLVILGGCISNDRIIEHKTLEGGNMITSYNQQGQPNGRWETTNKNGEVIDGGKYIDGVKQGLWIEMHLYGIARGNYKNGVKEGIWIKEWHDNITTQGEFKNGKPIGLWVNINQHGISTQFNEDEYKNIPDLFML